MRVEVRPQDGKPMTTMSGDSNQTLLNGDILNQVCFVSTDGKYKSVSLDFYTHDKSHIMELALKSEVYELHTKLIEVGENLKEIASNEQFQ